jgi:hypothetical protein
MPYAARTTVTVDRTKAEIEQTLTRYGADRFAYFVEPKGAVIIFEAHGRRLRFNLPLQEGTEAKSEWIRRQRSRALLLCIKAKLESVASDIETFEEAFLAHVVMPDNRTVYEHTAPRIAQIAKGGEMQPLLPGPRSHEA